MNQYGVVLNEVFVVRRGRFELPKAYATGV